MKNKNIYKQLNDYLKKESTIMKSPNFINKTEIVDLDILTLEKLNQYIRVAESKKAYLGQYSTALLVAIVAILLTTSTLVIDILFELTNELNKNETNLLIVILLCYVFFLVVLSLVLMFIEMRRRHKYKLITYFLEYLYQQKEKFK